MNNLKLFLQEKFAYDIKGASILIVKSQKSIIIKLIDLSSFQPYDDKNMRDEGFIKGLDSLIGIVSPGKKTNETNTGLILAATVIFVVGSLLAYKAMKR